MQYIIEWVYPHSSDNPIRRWIWGEIRARKAIDNYKIYIESWSPDTIDAIEEYAKQNNIFDYIKKSNSGSIQYLKFWKDWFVVGDNWMDETTGTGGSYVKDLFGANYFDNPKPVTLLKRIIYLSSLSNTNDLILDFFAWSGTTGHAVMALNAEEKAEAMKNGANPDEVWNRQYICVQLPEATDEKSEAYKAGYKKISEITAERLRRAGAKIREENPDISLDTGFRLYRLEESCYQVASVEYKSDDTQSTLESLEKAIQSGLSPLRDGVSDVDVMVEVLLKEGFPLTSVWDEVKIGDNTFLHTENAWKQLYMSFDGDIAMKTIQALTKEQSEAIFVVYDTALDDSRKVMLASRVKLRTI
jgi:DNA methylase